MEIKNGVEMEMEKINEMGGNWNRGGDRNGENGVVRKSGVEMEIGENETEAETKKKQG